VISDNEIRSNNEILRNYSSVKVAGRFVDGSAERRKGFDRESLISSSTSSVIVAENSIVCLFLGHKRTCSTLNTLLTLLYSKN